jgi:hypothetical protein
MTTQLTTFALLRRAMELTSSDGRHDRASQRAMFDLLLAEQEEAEAREAHNAMSLLLKKHLTPGECVQMSKAEARLREQLAERRRQTDKLRRLAWPNAQMSEDKETP